MSEQKADTPRLERVELQLLEDALFMAAAVDADKDRAERMRLTGEQIHNLIKATRAAAPPVQPPTTGKYYGPCPYCGELLGFGHLPEQCDKKCASVEAPVQATTLYDALRKLRNEVLGVLGLAREEIRQVIGNTNFNVLQLRLDEAKFALDDSGAVEAAPPLSTTLAEYDFVNNDTTGISSEYVRIAGKIYWATDAKELAEAINNAAAARIQELERQLEWASKQGNQFAKALGAAESELRKLRAELKEGK